MLSASSSFSQSVFTTKSLSQVTLTTEKQDRINRVGNLPHDGVMQYADVSTFVTWGMLDNGTPPFSVPGQTGTYTATLMNANYVSEQEYTYIGKINGSTNTNLGIPGSYLYLRLTVFPNTGNTWTTTKRILIQSSCFQGGGGNSEDRSAENERELVRPELFYLMPNPAGGTVMAGTHQSDHLIEQVVIFSANGDKVLESNIADKAVRSLTFDLEKVPSGFYYVRFITNAGVFTKVLSHIND